MIDYEEVLLALRARLEAVAEIPEQADRSWNNVDFMAAIDRAHIEEDFVPATSSLISAPAANGVIESTGVYVIRYLGLVNRGESLIRTVTAAILSTFPPGLSLTLGSGDRLYIRGDIAPYPSLIVAAGKGKARSTITIPWRVHSFNVITA